MRLFIIACVIFAVSPCLARTIIVDDNGPADFNNIQAAINDAINGDTIIVQSGTYTGSGNRDINFGGKAITVKSENGSENCIIDCQGDVNNPHRGFSFKHSEGINSVVDGFTITNGYGPSDYWDIDIYRPAGGGIYCYYSSPTIQNCKIIGNRTSYANGYGDGVGAGVCCDYASPTIKNCEIIDNISGYGNGAGIFGRSTNAYITDCVISGNYGGSGSGIAIKGGAPAIYRCIISNNTIFGRGSLYFESGASATITNCLITSNRSLTFSTIAGICCWNGGCNAVITNCTIVNNTLTVWGGAIYWKGGGATVTNCICRGNHRTDLSGGLREIYEDLTVNYTNIQDNGDPADWKYVAGIGNIDADPCFADAANDDYHLKSQIGRWNENSESWIQDIVTSPCINAGDPNSNWTAELWPNGKRINMGAYGGTPQASMSLSQAGNIADLDNSNQVNYIDLMKFVDKWLYQQVLLPEDLDRNGIVNFIDFAVFANNWFWAE